MSNTKPQVRLSLEQEQEKIHRDTTLELALLSKKLIELEKSMEGTTSNSALVTFKIPPQWKAQLEAIAKRTDTNLSEVLRKIVSTYFKE